LQNNVQIEVVNTGAKPVSSQGLAPTAGSVSTTKIMSRHAGLPRIRFKPDGTLDENSPQVLRLSSNDGDSLWIAQSRSRLNYEIRNTYIP